MITVSDFHPSNGKYCPHSCNGYQYLFIVHDAIMTSVSHANFTYKKKDVEKDFFQRSFLPQE